MEAASALREARKAAGLSQSQIAETAGTSQATVSAYENGTKEPSVATFSRLLAAAGARLAVETAAPAVAQPSAADLRRSGRTLAQVMALADALPGQHARALRHPREAFSERLVVLHESLSRGRIRHAFGGAIALAYWVNEPRGTSTIDLTVFHSTEDGPRVLAALPDGVAQPSRTAEAITRDSHAHLRWGDTPLDLSFAAPPGHRRVVPFEGIRIPVLGPVELAVFKVMFDRTRDWADIEAMAERGTLDFPAVRASLRRMLDPADARLARLKAVERAS